MLLCLSSRQWRVLEEPVEASGEVALEQPGGVAPSFSFADAPGDVVLGRWVVLAPMEDHCVQSAVELSVATAAESMPDRLT